jgi:hypothetical protein
MKISWWHQKGEGGVAEVAAGGDTWEAGGDTRLVCCAAPPLSLT